ncbi:MAG TPA: peptide-methionine (S)-S-oxide reductase MsrA [Longimicrobiales bacterium]|nr:peptide-methionine (S)-S-oxide reductase MsrA [Longimicrobiales bacterium]
MKRVVLSLALASLVMAEPSQAQQTAKATFAGGCFWCMEEVLDAAKGVRLSLSGYIGGQVKDPTYEQVSAGRTGHAEAVEVTYDPAKTSYAQLLDIFWTNIDPTVGDRQFCDVGNQYRPAIFYHNAEQKRLAEASKRRIEQSGRFKKVAVEIAPATEFYVAEDYHQDYYLKNPLRYKYYKFSCGRAQTLERLWGKKK